MTLHEACENAGQFTRIAAGGNPPAHASRRRNDGPLLTPTLESGLFTAATA
jgi:hypothetical protein